MMQTLTRSSQQSFETVPTVRDIYVKAVLEIARAYRSTRLSPYASLYRGEEAMAINLGEAEKSYVLAMIAGQSQDYL